MSYKCFIVISHNHEMVVICPDFTGTVPVLTACPGVLPASH